MISAPTPSHSPKVPVRFRVEFQARGAHYRPGDVAELSAATADDLVEDGIAEYAADGRYLTKGAVPGNGIARKIAATVTTKGAGDRKIRVICSTETLDRQGDIIVQHGWNLASYLKNPTVLFQHDHTKPIATTRDIGVRDGKLLAEIEFPPAGEVPLADQVYSLTKLGSINSVSVGFRVLASEPIPGGRGMRIFRQELLELSLVSIPAQPDAVVLERANSATHARNVIADLRRTDAGKSGTALEQRRADIARLRGDVRRKHLTNTGREG